MEMTIPAKSTGDLLQDLKNSAQIADYLQGNKDALLQDSFTDELNRLYKTQGRNKSEIAREAGISDIYLYQIFSGRRVPQRNRLISICLSMHLSVEETQRLLYLCGHAQLYAGVRHGGRKHSACFTYAGMRSSMRATPGTPYCCTV